MDNSLMQLKEICHNQKTISTSRLYGFVKEIEKMYIQQGKRIRQQKHEMAYLQLHLNRKRQFRDKKVHS